MIDEIFYRPRTGEDMRRATEGAPIYKYSDVCEEARKKGAVSVLWQMFKQSLNNVLLLQDPDNMSSGHWMGLSFNPVKWEIYFFSSYGGKPDFEKNKWISEDDQLQSGQQTDALNDGLREMCKLGFKVYFNDHPYQREGDNTATCGIWTAAFLNSGMNPDQFYMYNLRHHVGAPEYFQRYFM